MTPYDISSVFAVILPLPSFVFISLTSPEFDPYLSHLPLHIICVFCIPFYCPHPHQNNDPFFFLDSIISPGYIVTSENL